MLTLELMSLKFDVNRCSYHTLFICVHVSTVGEIEPRKQYEGVPRRHKGDADFCCLCTHARCMRYIADVNEPESWLAAWLRRVGCMKEVEYDRVPHSTPLSFVLSACDAVIMLTGSLQYCTAVVHLSPRLGLAGIWYMQREFTHFYPLFVAPK